ncbi:hypothetical protein HAX54_025916 [Datura stramonium]|uniref:Uncharacterized protein n=1 Tax=Datura stramonium TaxID=4076 RepID=A0ABS8V1J5_DATST|nr:hypothetical protein [Datura stramonium]
MYDEMGNPRTHLKEYLDWCDPLKRKSTESPESPKEKEPQRKVPESTLGHDKDEVIMANKSEAFNTGIGLVQAQNDDREKNVENKHDQLAVCQYDRRGKEIQSTSYKDLDKEIHSLRKPIDEDLLLKNY